MTWDGPGDVRRAQAAECLLQKVCRVSASPCLTVFSCRPFACLFPTESGRLVSCLDLLLLALAVLSVTFVLKPGLWDLLGLLETPVAS